MVKDIILDTDLGADSDDVVAIALLLAFKKIGRCRISGISASTTRKKAHLGIKAICNYFGEEVLIGQMLKPILDCDLTDHYLEELLEAYPATNQLYPSVNLLLDLLKKGKAKGKKQTLVTIGPLSNLKALLETNPKLVQASLDSIYLMGCNFEKQEAEWNILQDIEATRYVFKNSPVPIYVSPFELGEKIYTGAALNGANPVGLVLSTFNQKMGAPTVNSVRHSWDPVTVLAAVELELFELSSWGNVTIDENGISTFREHGGLHRILGTKDHLKIQEKIEKILSILQKERL